jgi:hypothetical protein
MLLNKQVPDNYVKYIYEEFRDLILMPYTDDIGDFHKKFSSKHMNSLAKIVGSNGSKLNNMTYDDLKKLIDYYSKHIQVSNSPKHPPGCDLLKSYSYWLKYFKNNDHEEVWYN